MSETINSINNVKAKKISQMPELDILSIEDNDFEKYWVLLGFKDEDNNIAENYKVNIFQLAQLLANTGYISGNNNEHFISYSLNGIRSAQNSFRGTTCTLRLIAETGYTLPRDASEIEVTGANIIFYDNLSGELKIQAIQGTDNISIYANAVPKDFELRLYLMYITSDLDGSHNIYHVNDEITLELETTEPLNFDLPARSGIQLTNLTFISYTINSNDSSKGTLKVRLTGTGTPSIKMTGVQVVTYYFGHSVNGDDILLYNELGIPTGPGSNFIELTKSRNRCPVDFNNSYGWDLYNIENGDVYVIVPKKFFIPNINVYIDENYNAYQRKNGSFQVVRNIQTYPGSYEGDPLEGSQMCYSFTYNDIEYWAYCITREGISGSDIFSGIGNIENKPIYISWNTSIPQLSANNDITITPGYCEVVRGNGATQRIEDPAFSIRVNVGTINRAANGSLIYNSGELTEETDVTFTAIYQGLTDTKEVIIPKPGEDETLQSITYNLGFDEIESGQSLLLSKENVLGYYSDDPSNPRQLADISRIQFTKSRGTIESVSATVLRYTAPTVTTDTQETITVTYKGRWQHSSNITIKALDNIGIYWPTRLPSAIYDNETILLDTTYFKIKPNNSYERITSGANLTVSAGSISNGVFTPPTVSNNTVVTFTVSYEDKTVSKTVTIKPAEQFELSNLYYYIGQYIPTSNTNPENDKVSSNSTFTGWREIQGSLSNYRPSNSLITNSINIYENVNTSTFYYVAVPNNIEIYDNNSTSSNIGKFGNPITIGGTTYNIYRMEGTVFNKKLFYVKAQSYYWYVGTDNPVSPDDNPSLITANHDEPGWHIIPNNPTTYIDPTSNPIWANNGGEPIPIAPGLTTVNYYLVIPAGVKAMDALSDVSLGNPIRTMIIDNYNYEVYQRSGLDWAYTLYYPTN